MKELLDWKLEFKSKLLQRTFNIEYNESAFQLTRITNCTAVVTALAAPICQYIASRQKVFDVDLYICVHLIFVYCLLWVPFLFFSTKVRKNGGVVGALIFGGLGIISNVSNIVNRNNYLYDHHGSTVGIFIVIPATILRLSCKDYIPLSVVNLIFSWIVSFTAPEASAQQKIAYAVPNTLYVILCVYMGYSIEKWSKYNFFQRQLADSSAAKLDWTAARDASLLRNIFPKNLSDELEKQMSNITAHPQDQANKFFVGKNISSMINANSSSTNNSHLSNSTTSNKLTSSSNANGNNNIQPISVAKSKGSAVELLPIPRPYAPSSRQSTRASLHSVLSLNPGYNLNSSGINLNTSGGIDLNTSGGISLNTSGGINLNTSGGITNLDPSRRDIYHNNSNIGILKSSTDPRAYSNQKRNTVPPLTVSVPRDDTPLYEINGLSSSSTLIIPPIVTTSKLSPTSELDHPFGVVTTGTPLRTPHHKPELQMFFTGAQHSDGSRIALSHSYPNVCVIFCDIVGFTNLSSLISPQKLVALLNELFTKFDEIMDRHQLEKIRTIGDAYLCVANMSIPLDNPEEICLVVALEMIEAVKTINNTLSLRVGIASGPLIAGVTGTMKWNYDIFGKPLTDANLMETLAPHDCVAVSKSIAEACKHDEVFTRHTSDEDVPYYVLAGDKLETLPEEILKSARSSNMDAVIHITPPSMSTVDEEVLAYIDIIPDLTEDFDNSEYHLDIKHKLGFSKEAVESETKLLVGRKVFFKFNQPELENEYYQVTVNSIRPFVKYYCILLGIFQIIIFLVDVAIYGSNAVPIEVKIVFPCSTAILFLFTVYYDFLDLNHYTTSTVSCFVVVFYGASLIITYAYMDTILHITWAMISMLIMTGFIRVPAVVMILSELLITIALTAFVALHGAPFPYSNHYLVIMYAFVVVSSYSLAVIQKGFRSRFLAHKKLKYDMYQQKIAQHRSQLLLENILPSEIIPRLHQASPEDSTGIVDHFEKATMMFINITNLEEITQQLDSSNTFQVYNDLFTLFDEATHAYGLEKIKTINSVYMVASGLPNKIENHVDVAVKLALEIYSICKNYSFPLIDEQVQVRIGIATGPVVAGIIGKKKYSYDCWSDTTNTASRMESNGWNGHLQCTAQSFELCSYKKYFSKRENLNIKGKGLMDTYVLQLSKFVK